MSTGVKPQYQFGPFSVDAENRLLLRDGQPVAVTAKVFDALLFLLQRHGKLVPKEDLVKALWPDTFVADANLTQAIFMARKALGEAASEQRYIVTVPGRGYRFDGEVLDAGPLEASVPAATVARAEPPTITRPGRRRRLWAAAAVTLVLAVVAGTVLWLEIHRGPPPPRTATLAVLPFENLTGDAEQDYFSDGLTDELTGQLARLDPQRVRVIASASAMHYKRSGLGLRQIGRELGADYLLAGSFRRSAEKVRVTAKLVRARDGTQVWARQYDRDLTDLLLLQAEVGREIADEIEFALGAKMREPPASFATAPTRDHEAYELYLKGRYLLSKRNAQALQQAAGYFQQATAKDPNYARAFAALANADALLSGYSLAPPPDLQTKARAAAVRALQLDESLAEAHTSLALIAQNYDWDWDTADKEYRRAIELNPNYATAHHWYAEHLALRGRFAEALVEIDRARQLDPLSLIIASDRGVILYFARQYNPAIRQFRSVLEMEPNFPRAQMIVYPYVQQGKFPEAMTDIKAWRRAEDTPWSWALETYVQGRWGHRAEAQRAFEQLIRQTHGQPINPFALVAGYLGLGDKDRAIALLEKAYTEHSPSLTALNVDPSYDPLRGDPRFQDLLRRLHFPESSGAAPEKPVQ